MVFASNSFIYAHQYVAYTCVFILCFMQLLKNTYVMEYALAVIFCLHRLSCSINILRMWLIISYFWLITTLLFVLNRGCRVFFAAHACSVFFLIWLVNESGPNISPNYLICSFQPIKCQKKIFAIFVLLIISFRSSVYF